jgi:hypothetical protein
MEPDWNSPTWLWVVKHLCSEKENRSRVLESSDEEVEMRRLQGDIRTLNLVINLPAEYTHLKKKGKG